MDWCDSWMKSHSRKDGIFITFSESDNDEFNMLCVWSEQGRDMVQSEGVAIKLWVHNK